MESLQSRLASASLADNLADITRQIQASPANADLRAAFVQLLCLAGNWTRAQTQLLNRGGGIFQLRMQLLYQLDFQRCAGAQPRRPHFAYFLQPCTNSRAPSSASLPSTANAWC
jgi:hypothetical protein